MAANCTFPGRRWSFTLNNYIDDEVSTVKANATNYKYLIFGYETAATGTKYLQGFIIYKNLFFFYTSSAQ